MTEHGIERVFITGIGGTGASYLAEHILEAHPGVAVHGLLRGRHARTREVAGLLAGRVTIHQGDLADLAAVTAALEAARPDAIFHLASNADVRGSFDRPADVLADNIGGTCTLFEAVHRLGIAPLIQHCSTSEVYGQVEPERVPIREDCPFRPASPYAVSKVAQDCLALAYHRAHGLPIVRTRMFTYINPRREDLFASAFARQVARIEVGLQDTLVHGNLDSIRTVVDVRDAMTAYWLATVRGRPGEVYNIGGRASVSVGDFLDRLAAGSRVPVRRQLDPALLRPSDVTLQVPCVDKFVAATGWAPRYSLEESVAFLLDYWRRRVADAPAPPARPPSCQSDGAASL